MDIRQASTDDLDVLAPLFDGYRRFYGQPGDVAAGRAFLQARLQQDESVILLALQFGRAVGFCQLYPIFSSVSMRRAWLLNDLFVDSAARGQGVGEQTAGRRCGPWSRRRRGLADAADCAGQLSRAATVCARRLAAGSAVSELCARSFG